MNIESKYFITYASNRQLVKIGLNLILFFIFCSSFSQITTSNNDFILTRQNIDLNNSSLSDTCSYLNIGNQSFMGDLAGVRSFYAIGNFSRKHSRKSYSLLGGTAINSQFGPLISDLQLRLSYSYRLQLAPRVWGLAGTELGIAGISFEGTSNTSGGSDLTPDFNVMFAFGGSQWRLGTSLNHITNPVVQPLNEQFRYMRNVNLYAEYIFKLSHRFNLTSYYQSIFLASDYLYRGSLLLTVSDRFDVGAGVRNEGVTMKCGIRKMELKTLDLSVHVGYRIPDFSKTLNNTHLFQIQLGAIFKGN